MELPDVGLATFEDLESGEMVVVDTSDKRVRAHYRSEMTKIREARRQLFFKLGARLGRDRDGRIVREAASRSVRAARAEGAHAMRRSRAAGPSVRAGALRSRGARCVERDRRRHGTHGHGHGGRRRVRAATSADASRAFPRARDARSSARLSAARDERLGGDARRHRRAREGRARAARRARSVVRGRGEEVPQEGRLRDPRSGRRRRRAHLWTEPEDKDRDRTPSRTSSCRSSCLPRSPGAT